MICIASILFHNLSILTIIGSTCSLKEAAVNCKA